MLDGVERLAAAADEDAEVVAHEVNEVRVVALFHGVRHGVGAHVLQKALDEGLDALFSRAGLRGSVDLRLCRGCGLFGLLLAGLGVAALRLRAAVFAAAVLPGLLGCLGGSGAGLGRAGRFGRGGGDDLRRCGRDDLRAVRGLGLGGLFRLAAGGGGQGRLGRFVRCLIGDLDARGLRADAKEPGLRIVQHFDGDAVAVHAQLLQRSCDGQIDRLTGCGDKFFHSYSFVCSASDSAARFLP